MPTVEVLSAALLDGVSAEARESPRARKNRNFHAGPDARCHRLLNAIEPGSYVQPHRHLAPEKDETIVVVRGSLGLVCFGPDGAVSEALRLTAGGDRFGAHIPAGVFHTLFALQPGTVFFETKAGPYAPPTAEERGDWAPAEGDPDVAERLRAWEALVR